MFPALPRSVIPGPIVSVPAPGSLELILLYVPRKLLPLLPNTTVPVPPKVCAPSKYIPPYVEPAALPRYAVAFNVRPLTMCTLALLLLARSRSLESFTSLNVPPEEVRMICPPDRI